MSARARRTAAGEAGFTIVELLVAMTLSLIVATAALSSFDAFNAGVARNSRLTDAEDTARRQVGVMVRALRNGGTPPAADGTQAAAIQRAGGNDIVFLSTSWPGESRVGVTGAHVQRYCLNTATKTLWFDGLKAGTAGPSNPGTACPSTAQGWVHRGAVPKVVNTAARPIFSYPATGTVRSVGVDLLMEGGDSRRARPVELRSAATLRGALAPIVSPGDVAVDCTSAGPGKALLSLGVGRSLGLSAPGGVGLGPGKLLLDLSSVQNGGVNLVVSNLLGLQKLLFKPVSC